MYHQEFDLKTFFPNTECNVQSVVNFKHIMEDDFNVAIQLEKKLKNWEFKYYGANNRDGILDDDEKCISDIMKKFGFVFHVKKDEGYGHVIHNAFACGKPSVVNINSSFFKYDDRIVGNTSSFLFKKDLTVIDINDGIEVVSEKLKIMSENYETYSKKVYDTFKSVVDFDYEEMEIRKFIENLI